MSDQVKFIDAVKYYQQNLLALASSMRDEEKRGVRIECERFIKNNPKLNEKFFAPDLTNREWILDYPSSRKGVLPYEMIQRPESLDITPEKDKFF